MSENASGEASEAPTARATPEDQVGRATAETRVQCEEANAVAAKYDIESAQHVDRDSTSGAKTTDIRVHKIGRVTSHKHEIGVGSLVLSFPDCRIGEITKLAVRASNERCLEHRRSLFLVTVRQPFRPRFTPS